MNTIIPIFPLPLVVFPNSKYPLHIFEPKYKKLIYNSLVNNSGFGIVTTFAGDIHPIGCFVTIETPKSYTSIKDIKEFDIVVVGQVRFKILSKWEHNDGYYLAEISTYDDERFNFDSEYFQQLQDKFSNLVKRIDYKLEDSFWNNLLIAKEKSFKLAEKSGLTLEQQLKFISLQDETERLMFLFHHIDKIEKYLDEKATVIKLVLNDGYLN